MALSEDLITVGKAAHLIERTPQRIKQLVDEGRLVAEWTPYGRLISRRSCEALIADRAQKQKAGAANAR